MDMASTNTNLGQPENLIDKSATMRGKYIQIGFE